MHVSEQIIFSSDAPLGIFFIEKKSYISHLFSFKQKIGFQFSETKNLFLLQTHKKVMNHTIIYC